MNLQYLPFHSPIYLGDPKQAPHLSLIRENSVPMYACMYVCMYNISYNMYVAIHRPRAYHAVVCVHVQAS